MHGQIEQQNDFEKDMYNNPINLINGIKEQILNFQDTIYEMEIIDNSLTYFPLKKQKDEELYKYMKRFKSFKQVFK